MTAEVIMFPRRYKECACAVTRGLSPEEQKRLGGDFICDTCGAIDPHKGSLL